MRRVVILTAAVSTIISAVITAGGLIFSSGWWAGSLETNLAATVERVDDLSLNAASLQAGLLELNAELAELSTSSGIVGPPGPEGPAGPMGPRGPKGESGPIPEELLARVEQLEQAIADFATQPAAPLATVADLREQRVASLNGFTGGNEAVTSDGILWQFRECTVSSQYATCSFSVTNTTTRDIDACVGTNNRMIFDNEVIREEFSVYIGNDNNWRSLCSEVPATATISSSIVVGIATAVEPGNAEDIRIFRFDCGRGCQMELYDIPIRFI